MESETPSVQETTPDRLQAEIAQLQSEIQQLRDLKQHLIAAQTEEIRSLTQKAFQEIFQDYERRRQELQDQTAVLQRKLDRIQQEMKTTYAGVSQDIAVRVQGFKDYLVGSLQDLVVSVEKLQLTPSPAVAPPVAPEEPKDPEAPPLAEQVFANSREKIEQLLERYRTMPDYYGPAWKLRRTFERVHADRVGEWFFALAGRGALKTMGTRLQNILVTSAAVSILRVLYGNKVRLLLLATSPERLGEWRRGFQDCLGISRDSFGPDRGVTLFEDPEPLVAKAEKMLKDGLMPFVIIDEAEEFVFVELLRFPLLMAFGKDPDAKPTFGNYGRDFDF